ncbi:acyltransferase [Frigoribacterium sp. Leaf164]|uniref:acyltransferase family protein n=1 Tax=Frigoribacterium sp. Leaf164 TaxID=1736282 RepID=UPI0012E0E7F7|nr:acyltransferase [Frigoribacterium sp. Leaf164]
MPAPGDPVSPTRLAPLDDAPPAAPRPSAPRSGASRPPRQVGVDVARGLCVLLVALHHAILYPADVPEWLRDVTIALAPFRMPLLMFLSGALVPATVGRGARSFLLARARSVLWPLVVWGAVIVAVDVARGIALGRLDEAVADTTSHLPWGTWFLAYLLIFGVVALLARRLHPGLLAAGAALASLTVPELPGDLPGRFWAMAVFFFLGVWSGRRPEALRRACASRGAVLVSAVVVAATAAVAVALGGDSPAFQPWAALPVAGSFVALVAGATWLGRRRVGRFPALVGGRSITWYLPHTIGVKAGHDLSVALGAPPLVEVALCLIGALSIGAVLHLVVTRWPRADVLFRWPRRTAPGR